MQQLSPTKGTLRFPYFSPPSGVAERSTLTAEFLLQRVADFEAPQARIDALESELLIDLREAHGGRFR